DFLFQYQYGNSTQLIAQLNSYENLANADNKVIAVLSRWTTPGQITSLPRAYNGTEPLSSSQGTFSSRVVDDASYIRLKTATLNYTIPAKFTQRIGFAGVTVFVQGLNLLTFTNFRGDDPENTGTNLNFYPNERTITAGIKAKF
ncbi:MAG: TonB-dependent receptor, partial [Bacteroidota bacterium]|nr:TonB-dependent receptor [Bacteroidota bacterium]